MKIKIKLIYKLKYNLFSSISLSVLHIIYKMF